MSSAPYSPQATLQKMRLMMDGTVRVSTLKRSGFFEPQDVAQAVGLDVRGQRWTLAAVLAQGWVSNSPPRDFRVMTHVLDAHPVVLNDPHTVGALVAAVWKPATATRDSSASAEEGDDPLNVKAAQALATRIQGAMQRFTPEQRLRAETVASDLILMAVESELNMEASAAVAGWRAGLMSWFDALARKSHAPGNEGWPVSVGSPLASTAARLITACIARQERVDANMQSFKEFKPIEGVDWPTVLTPELQRVLHEVLADTLSTAFPQGVSPDDPRWGAGWQRSLWAVKALGLLVAEAPEEALIGLVERLQPVRQDLDAAIHRLGEWHKGTYSGRRDIDEIIASLCEQGRACQSRLRSVELEAAWGGSVDCSRKTPRF